MRKAWMDWVGKTRKRGNRGKENTMTHRQALKAAAVTWPKEKAKLLRKRKRLCKKKVGLEPPARKPDVPADESALV
jgi:hypothetical protein